MDLKKMREGEIRFIIKKIDKLWRVYDKARGGFPYESVDLGTVQQDVSQAEADLEAERLNEIWVVKPKVAKSKPGHTKRKGFSASSSADAAASSNEKVVKAEDAEEPVEEVEAYEELSQEKKGAYEAGLFEKPVY